MVSLAMLMILVSPTQSTEASAKGTTKKSVTIQAGKKKKIKLKISKIKKIKVKSSKKSVATVKAIGKKKIQITGKKAGKATITVKVTTKNKKVKTIKYKVTVKKKKKATTQETTESEETTTEQTETTETPAVVQSIYNYELKVMNTKTLYNDTKVVVYIKTNNPNPSSITADCGTKKAVKHEDESGTFYTYEDEFKEIVEPNNYADVTYTDNAYAVNGGYLRTYQWDTAGVKNFTIYEKIGTIQVEVAKLPITLQDKTQAENAWVKAVMDEVTNDTMTKPEKLKAVEAYILANFKYDRNNEQGEIQLLTDVGAYWERKHIDCWDATYIMCRFAQELGLTGKETYAGYALHYYTTVTIDGTAYTYDACPDSETGWTTEWTNVL